MAKKDSIQLFNNIANFYGLFFNHQKNQYLNTIDKVSEHIDLKKFHTVVDIGCGTGALCAALSSKGLEVTGIDPAEKMLNIAKKKLAGEKVVLLKADVLEKLPFRDHYFDIAIASYVAHGMNAYDRQRLYIEMSRIAKDWVIIHDFNDKRSIVVSFVEWLEKGDYFRFIKIAEKEMKNCVNEIKKCFSEVRVINVGVRANWYICKPNNQQSR